MNLHDLFIPPSILLPAWTFPQDTFLNSLQVFPRPCNGTKKPLDSSRPRVFFARFSYLTWKKFKMEKPGLLKRRKEEEEEKNCITRQKMRIEGVERGRVTVNINGGCCMVNLTTPLLAFRRERRGGG